MLGFLTFNLGRVRSNRPPCRRCQTSAELKERGSLGARQPIEVLARRLDLDGARDLHLARVLLDRLPEALRRAHPELARPARRAPPRDLGAMRSCLSSVVRNLARERGRADTRMETHARWDFVRHMDVQAVTAAEPALRLGAADGGVRTSVCVRPV